MEAQKIYRTRTFYSNMYLTLGSIVLLSSLFLGMLLQIGLGILFIVVGLIDRNRALIKLFDDYFEFKGAIAAPLVLVKYSNIEGIELVKKQIIIKLKPGTAKKRELKIATLFLEKEDVPDLIEELRRRTEASEPLSAEI